MSVKYRSNSDITAVGQTTFDDGHSHSFELPINGIGITGPGPKDGHVHYVSKWSVGITDGHNHIIKRD